MRILFVQTGGTIDKDYPRTTNGWGFEISEEPAVQRLLSERLTPSFSHELAVVCRKDSTEVNDADRSELADTILSRVAKPAASSENESHHRLDGVVVTHGTDTMAETARFLADRFGGSSSSSDRELLPPVLLTGAMRPERFSNSDADFHLGMAVAAAQVLPPGFVGICMHGLVLGHDEIGRDASTGRFVRCTPGA